MKTRAQIKERLEETGYSPYLLDIKHKRVLKVLIGLTYPVLGNLPCKIQENLERRLEFHDTNTSVKNEYIDTFYGGHLYDKIISTRVSILTNLPIYACLLTKSYGLFHNYISDDIYFLGVVLIAGETIVRTRYTFDHRSPEVPILAQPMGNILGKIISLPYEWNERRKHRNELNHRNELKMQA